MASKAALMLAIGAAVGFLWWLSRPAATGTKINPVAGIRG
jgi:hypothetical protein